MKQPAQVYREITGAYQRYVDTAYWLRSEEVMEERRRLLEGSNLLFTEPLIEPVLPYSADVVLAEVAVELGIESDAARIVADALFGAFTAPGEAPRVRAHQADALRAAFQPGSSPRRNPIVTSGTGSGKTESFLLPLLMRIVEESQGWGDDTPPTRWWEAGSWAPLRSGSARPSGVRAAILYPTNALVEDQIVRLRRAVRSIKALGGKQLWFGRYTGASPGSGPLPTRSKAKAKEHARDLHRMCSEFDSLSGVMDADELVQFVDPRAGEMISRWDMIVDPPDVLVTNYSMLNAMLMRQVEDPIFEKTRSWLESNPTNVFTLVVDELHLYRGTQGSEVAMIVRSLLSRLGIEPGSPQLRCIGTSASLAGGAAGAEYLEQFFGVDRNSFAVISGEPVPIEGSIPISGATDESPEALSHSVALACVDPATGQPRATKLSRVAERLLPGSPNAAEDLEEVLAKIAGAEGGSGLIPLRAHMFARTLQGLWACSNPRCTEVTRDEDLGFGRLFSRPAATCACGGRVLELLYCFECGDMSLGGWVIDEDKREGWAFLSATPGSVSGSRELPLFKRPHSSYRWYRPGTMDSARSWKLKGHDGDEGSVSFASIEYDPKTGLLHHSPSARTGTAVVGVTAVEGADAAALPPFCPRCDLGNAVSQEKYSRGVVRSPIRAHTSGLAQSVQLYLTELHRSVGGTVDESKTIVFSDSRDAAARTAAGAEASQFNDLLRQIIRQALDADDDVLAIMRAGSAPGGYSTLTAEQRVVFDSVSRNDMSLMMAFRDEADGRESPEQALEIQRFAEGQTDGLRLDDAAEFAFDRLRRFVGDDLEAIEQRQAC